mmetsp:Transcript_68969/g.222923  ORF Transcript_68969/g.222923 Transcript_68969/m.222923 type:complete len:273 (-) Transcript_68969:97-915(-)
MSFVARALIKSAGCALAEPLPPAPGFLEPSAGRASLSRWLALRLAARSSSWTSRFECASINCNAIAKNMTAEASSVVAPTPGCFAAPISRVAGCQRQFAAMSSTAKAVAKHTALAMCSRYRVNHDAGSQQTESMMTPRVEMPRGGSKVSFSSCHWFLFWMYRSKLSVHSPSKSCEVSLSSSKTRTSICPRVSPPLPSGSSSPKSASTTLGRKVPTRKVNASPQVGFSSSCTVAVRCIWPLKWTSQKGSLDGFLISLQSAAGSPEPPCTTTCR